MERFIVAAALLLVTGCAAVVTPEGTFLEPLPFAVTIAPSIVAVEPSPVIVQRIRPLPSAYIYPNRYIYSYGDLYYHYWDGGWYYGPATSGPWYVLPRNYYPPRVYRGR